MALALALPGTLFFKPMWFTGQRLQLSSQAELFRSYYQSDVLFAVGFPGLQMRALSGILSHLTGGQVSPLMISTVLGIILFGYVAIGGMRAVGYHGAFQLWTPLLGLTWLRWITRPAAVCGVMFGLAGMLLTEPLGYQILSFLGLEL